MDLPETIDQYLRTLRSRGASYRSPASAASLDIARIRLGFSEPFIYLYSRFDGLEPGSADPVSYLGILPIEYLVENRDEIYRSSFGKKLQSTYFVFGESLIWSHVLAGKIGGGSAVYDLEPQSLISPTLQEMLQSAIDGDYVVP